MSQIRTEEVLEAVTDEGLFERVATAVLREAEPRYHGLVHPGVNAAGKTIKSPVDAITFLEGSSVPHMLVVHHTTTARRDLEKKWLHDPATVAPRKGNKPTAPPGDLVKTLTVIADQRKLMPGMQATLVLTTNREPDEATVRAVQAAAAPHGLTIDLWSRSRLAHFLDHDPQGQWLRRDFFGIEPERLSLAWLNELSKKSLMLHAPPDREDAWVMRELDGALRMAPSRVVTFLVAPSGMGKSIACYRWLATHVADGGAGLVLPDDAVAGVSTLENAIGAALHNLHPGLPASCGSDALALCSSDCPLFLVVEDINRAGRAVRLAEKIESWARNRPKSEAAASGVRLLCPLWPEVLTALSTEARKRIAALSIFGTAFSEVEGRLAVQRRASLLGRAVSNLDADMISTALGHDPLLIGLHDPAKGARSGNIIGDYIENALCQAAVELPDHPAAEFRQALRTFAATALKRRDLSPKWSTLGTWSELSELDRRLMSRLIYTGTVLHFSGESSDQTVRYRHDRVRDWLLADAAVMLEDARVLPDEIVADPYYAEIMAGVIADERSQTDSVSRIAKGNSLAPFLALKLLRVGSDRRKLVATAIDAVLTDPTFQITGLQQLRWAAVVALAQTDGPEVIGIAGRLRTSGDALWQARLRNGDVGAAIELCRSVEPGIGASWRDRQLDHAKQKFGNMLTKSVSEVLQRSELSLDGRIGAVRLAGHLADFSLAESVKICWNTDGERLEHLDDYLWAFAQCCGAQAERFLGPVCDAWATLSDEPEKEHHTPPRLAVAADHLHWAFRRCVPVNAIDYLVVRAKREEALHRPILVLLQYVDEPQAIAFQVEEVAEMRRREAGTGSVYPFAMLVERHWQEHQERDGVLMSKASRTRLLLQWQAEDTELYVRKTAFAFWAANRVDGDLDILCRNDLPASLAGAVLRERVMRKDVSAIPTLIENLKDHEHAPYWWQFGKYIWSDELTNALDGALSERALASAQASGVESDLDHTYSDLLMRISPEVSEMLLLKHWESLQHSVYFLQSAIFVATPSLLALARASVAKLAEPKKVFEHMSMRFGIWLHGHPGIIRRSQLDALLSYSDLMDELSIHSLWELCNQRGWYDVRRRELDPVLRRQKGDILYVDDVRTFASLDELATHNWPYMIDHWLERYEKTGAGKPEMIALLGRWLGERKTPAALALAAQGLIEIGQRADLSLLDADIAADFASVEAIKADTRYAVQRRTLR